MKLSFRCIVYEDGSEISLITFSQSTEVTANLIALLYNFKITVALGRYKSLSDEFSAYISSTP